jgi:hypothetical protein
LSDECRAFCLTDELIEPGHATKPVKNEALRECNARKVWPVQQLRQIRQSCVSKVKPMFFCPPSRLTNENHPDLVA